MAPTSSGEVVTGSTTDVPNPSKVVVGAWLTPDVLPLASNAHWTQTGPTAVTTTMLGQDLVLPLCNPVVGQDLIGDQNTNFTSPGGAVARQHILLYSTTAAAQTAYQQTLASNQNCQNQSRTLQAQAPGAPLDATVNRTGAITDGSAWTRRWTAVHGTAVLDAATDHMYVVQRGTALTIVGVSDTAGATPTPDADQALLKTIAAELCTYGGPCA